MKDRAFGIKLISVVVAIMALPALANADPIDIASGPGTACTFEAGSGMAGDPCSTVAIQPHALWQGNDPSPPGYGGVWVSYADTGIDGGTVAPTSNLPIFTIVETFTVTTAATIDFWVWADDTADLYFNLAGAALELVFGANFSQNICANGSIGCEADEFYNLTAVLDPGTYDITMSVYQIGTGTTNPSNPFGVLYSGRVTAVREPGTLALIGIGLLAIGIARRRSKANKDDRSESATR